MCVYAFASSSWTFLWLAFQQCTCVEYSHWAADLIKTINKFLTMGYRKIMASLSCNKLSKQQRLHTSYKQKPLSMRCFFSLSTTIKMNQIKLNTHYPNINRFKWKTEINLLYCTLNRQRQSVELQSNNWHVQVNITITNPIRSNPIESVWISFMFLFCTFCRTIESTNLSSSILMRANSVWLKQINV